MRTPCRGGLWSLRRGDDATKSWRWAAKSRLTGDPRRQRTVVGDGALGARFGFSSLEHVAARGPGRPGQRHGALPPGAALVRRTRCGPCFLGPGVDAGCRRDLPLQRPRCLLDPSPGAGGVGLLACHRDRPDDRARALRCAGRPGLPDQDARCLHHRAGTRARLPVVRSAAAGPAHRATRLGRGSPCSSRAAGGSPSSNCGRAASRPYIGGSTDNSELNLIFGYNGFARIFGSGGGGAGGGTTSGTSSAFGGGEGLLRMFDSELGGQISWLLPVALVGLVGGLWLTRRHGAGRQPALRVCPLGRHAPDVPRGIRLCQGHLPSVLHGRHGAGDRCSGRRGRRGSVASRPAVTPLVPGSFPPPLSAPWSGPTPCSPAPAATTRGSDPRSS